MISCEETDDTFLDGYYYRVEFNGIIREFKLHYADNWKNDVWIKANGQEFLNLVDRNNKWDFFKEGRKLNEIKILHSDIKLN